MYRSLSGTGSEALRDVGVKLSDFLNLRFALYLKAVFEIQRGFLMTTLKYQVILSKEYIRVMDTGLSLSEDWGGGMLPRENFEYLHPRKCN
jgi:hypothetical protein